MQDGMTMPGSMGARANPMPCATAAAVPQYVAALPPGDCLSCSLQTPPATNDWVPPPSESYYGRGGGQGQGRGCGRGCGQGGGRGQQASRRSLALHVPHINAPVQGVDISPPTGGGGRQRGRQQQQNLNCYKRFKN